MAKNIIICCDATGNQYRPGVGTFRLPSVLTQIAKAAEHRLTLEVLEILLPKYALASKHGFPGWPTTLFVE